MTLCPRCCEQPTTPEREMCMACEADLLVMVAPLGDLPPHEVTEQGVNAFGQRFVRVRYADGSVDLIDPVPWEWAECRPAPRRR